MEKRKALKWLVGAALALWLAGILFPMAWASRSNAAWHAWFNHVFSPAWVHIAMHAALYAVLVLGLNWLFEKRLRGLRLWGIVLLVAFAQEGLQLWGATRVPGWGEAFDLVVDASGAVVGILIYRCLQGRQVVGNSEVKK